MEVNEFASFVDQQLEKVQVPTTPTFTEIFSRRNEQIRPTAGETEYLENIQWIPHSGPRPWRKETRLFITNQSRVVKKTVKEIMGKDSDMLKYEQLESTNCVRSDSKIELDFESHIVGDNCTRMDDKALSDVGSDMNQFEIVDGIIDDDKLSSAATKDAGAPNSFILDIPEQLNFSPTIKKKRSSSMDFGLLPRTNSYLSFISLRHYNDTQGSTYYDPCVQAAKNFKSSQSRIKSFLKRSTTTKSNHDSQRWSLDICRDQDRNSSNMNRLKAFFKQGSPTLSLDSIPTASNSAEPSSASSSNTALTFQSSPRTIEIVRRPSYTSSPLLNQSSRSQESLKSIITQDSIELETESYPSNQAISKTLQKMKSIVRVSLFGRRKLPSIPDYQSN